MKLIIGLGNPGREYEKTRHNAGFMVVDKMAELLHLTFDQKKFKGEYIQTNIKGEKVYILKPQTYMNLSGESVRELSDYFNIDIEDMLLIYDDLDLPVGKIRLRKQGSAGGQKGVKSIIQHLGTQDIKRIRIGIGKDPRIPTVDYVLGKVRKEDMQDFEEAIVDAAKAAIDFASYDFDYVMQTYNKK